MRTSQPRWSVYWTLFVYTLAIRLAPYAMMRLGIAIDPQSTAYPWNFSPALAFGLYGAAVLPRRSAGLLAPVAVYLASDLGIWLLTGRADWAFYPYQPAVYGALMLCAACGWLLREDRTWAGVFGCALLAPVLFFLVTNFATWLGSGLFPQTFSGLVACYAAGLAHHRNLLVSTLLFSGLLFSPLGVRSTARQTASEPPTLLAS